MATNREVFDAIAATWYGVRHWPILPHELELLSQRWRRGRLLNLGCGVGADFLPFKDSFALVGLDFSSGMLRQAFRYTRTHAFGASLDQGELSYLPFEDGAFDFAIAIACYHHLEGENVRAAALVELRRTLRPGGEAFISVWNHEQPRFATAPRDVLVPWGDEDSALTRYYHLYTCAELETALLQSGFSVIRLGHGTRRHDPTQEDERNICALIARPEGEA